MFIVNKNIKNTAFVVKKSSITCYLNKVLLIPCFYLIYEWLKKKKLFIIQNYCQLVRKYLEMMLH